LTRAPDGCWVPIARVWKPGHKRTMRRHTLALVVTALVCDVANAFDRKPWLADYAALKQGLERDYGHLAWFASPEGGVDLPALDKKTLTRSPERAAEDSPHARFTKFVLRCPDQPSEREAEFVRCGELRPTSTAPSERINRAARSYQ
jgi:hypothetical protein